jgi:hypothetical protein
VLGVVRLEVGGLVGDVRVGHRVAPVKAVVGELRHQAEDLARGLLGDLVLDAAGDELLLVDGHLLALLLAHRAAHEVGLAQGVAAEPLRELHDLLLVDQNPVGVPENLLHLRDEVLDGLLAVVAVDEVVDHPAVERAGAVEGV